MKEDQINNFLKQFTQLTIGAIKEILANKQQLSAKSLLFTLSHRRDIRDLIYQYIVQQSKQKNYSTDDDSKNGDNAKAGSPLSDQELIALREKLAGVETFYKEVLQFIIKPVPQDVNEELDNQISKFKSMIDSGAEYQRLVLAFKRIKMILPDDYQISAYEDKQKQIKEKSSLLSFFSRPQKDGEKTEETYLSLLQDSYQSILDGFKPNLDADGLERLIEIENKILNVRNMGDYLEVSQEITSMIGEFNARLNDEIEESATFFKRMGRDLIEAQTHFLESLSYNQKTYQLNSEFNTLIEDQIEALKDSVKYSKTLVEIKSEVDSGVAQIHEAINKKREEDSANQGDAEKVIEILRDDLDHMKTEVDQARERAEALEKELLTDPLTNIYNRIAYDKRIQKEFLAYKKMKKVFSELYFDVDYFRKVNDNYGRSIGDKCLKEMISRVKSLFKKTSFLARYGGDQFIAVLSDTGIEQAQEVAEQLREFIEQIDFIYKNVSENLTVSVGVTTVLPMDQDSDQMFHRLDQALYEAKQKGRNRVVAIVS